MGVSAGCQKELYVLDYVITFHMGVSAGCQKELYVLDYVITFHMGFVRKEYIGEGNGCHKGIYRRGEWLS